MLVTATVAAGAGALARANTEGGEPGGMSAPRRGAGATLAAAKTGKAPAASKLTPARPSAPVVVAEPAAGASLPPVARPTPLPGEREHIARYDTAIAPLRNLTLAEEDAALLREAISTGANGKLAEAKSLRERIKDAATRKLVDWYLYRAGYGAATEIRAFEANPAWPDRAFCRSAPRRPCSTARLPLPRSKPSSPTRNPRPGWA